MVRTLTVVLLILGLAGPAAAQPSLDEVIKSADLDVGGGLLSQAEPQVTAALGQSGDVVTLAVRVDLPEGGYIYSQDAKAVEPAKPTKFEVLEATGLTPLDPGFTPSHPAKKSYDAGFRKELEKHFGTITWTRRYQLDASADLAKVAVRGEISLQYCKDNCRPMKLPFTAALRGATAAAAASTGVDELPPPTELFGDAAETPPAVEELTGPPAAAGTVAAAGALSTGYSVVPQYGGKNHRDGDPAKVSFVLDTTAAPGLAILAIKLELAEEFHVRAITKADGQELPPTTLEIGQLQGLTAESAAFAPTVAAELHEEKLGATVLRSLDHDGEVTWTRVFKLEPSAAAGLTGTLSFQICKGSTFCLPPKTVTFGLGALQTGEHTITASAESSALAADVRTAALKTSTGGDSQSTGSLAGITYEDEAQANSLPTWLLFSFLGGLILNVMPCVLPVISIKALSFVHQAGEQPGRILLLNVVYSLGVLSVFFALATLALTLKLGWGAQNQSAAYNIVMVAVVFAMGLSLLGVFEIPIPGMMSSGIGGKQHGEGLLGAFLTGILATLLATPCTGPYMATTLFWSLQQPTHIVFLIFGVMGLGMASPYLLIGCFPKLIDWLPRPGNWMVTFKQVCGFLLMGTCVWMLNTIHALNTQLTIPALIILVGVAVLVWMVGNLYDLSSTQARRWVIRGLAVLIAGPIIALGANWSRQAVLATHGEYELPWQEFSGQKLEELVHSGKSVLVDFTAEWCGICKANEFSALNTEPTYSFIQEHGFVPLKADYTNESPEIGEWLQRFGQNSVPMYLFIPGGQSEKAFILREKINQEDVLSKLQETLAYKTTSNLGASTAARPEEAVSLTR